MDDFWKLVIGGVVTLISGLALHQFQLGSRRRRLRRDIREQLELLALLGEHPEAALRVREKVTAALETYEPANEEAAHPGRSRWIGGGSFVVATLLLISLWYAAGLRQPADFSSVLLLALGIPLVAFLLDDLVHQILDTREKKVTLLADDELEVDPPTGP